MGKKKQIRKLKKRIAKLEARLILLEAQRYYPDIVSVPTVWQEPYTRPYFCTTSNTDETDGWVDQDGNKVQITGVYN